MSGFYPYVLAIVSAWVLAHVIKYVIAAIKGTRLKFNNQVFISGGMPSAHVATTVALGVVILLRDGFDSGLFALAALLTLIVAHDALRVRRATGEQGEAIAKLIHETKSMITPPRSPKGHTPPEVIVGALFGALIGIIVFIATR